MHMQMTKRDPKEAQQYFQDKLDFTVGPVDVNHGLEGKEDFNIVDVRRAEDYEKGHVPGAISLPSENWSSLGLLSRDKINIVYCYSQTCHLAARAAVLFADKGYPVKEMEGGFQAWQDFQFPVETAKAHEREPAFSGK